MPSTRQLALVQLLSAQPDMLGGLRYCATLSGVACALLPAIPAGLGNG
jgi:hypothetical protein